LVAQELDGADAPRFPKKSEHDPEKHALGLDPGDLLKQI
jgi:hypothetical protein